MLLSWMILQKKSGSINLLIKNKKKLLGFNTDVYGAIETIKYQIKKYNKIIIFGLGETVQLYLII